MADKVLILDAGAMDAFGSRREVAGKIRNGRTSIPYRQPQVIAARTSAGDENMSGTGRERIAVTQMKGAAS